MADGGERFTIRVIEDLAAVPAAQWDACAGDQNPFLCHAFLQSLEESGSATRRTGWLPPHLLLEDAAGRHARAAVGVGSLPGGVAVEVEAVFEVS